MSQRAVPATLMRGGSSRGLYVRADDLPEDIARRDAVLLAAMGSPDARQIDGVGGGHPLTSKVAVLSRPSRADADVDYLFLQVSGDTATVSDAQNCGNLLAGVGPWAIENGFVEARADVTDIAIHMVNSGRVAVASVQTPGGTVDYAGSTRIDGVPGSAAPVPLSFLDIAGSSCGALLPTGNALDLVDGIELTCIDNGMPVVLLRARDVGASGHETPAELEANATLRRRIETLRLALGARMQLGDVAAKSVPKMCLLSAPANGGAISTRCFIPHRVHDAIGVFGAVSVATACVLPGTVAGDIAVVESSGEVVVEHPSGSFSVALELDERSRVTRSALLRTARKLFAGEVYVPARLFGESDP